MVSWNESHFKIYFYQWHHEHFRGKWIETFFSFPYGHNSRKNLFIHKLSPESMLTSCQRELSRKLQWYLGQDTINFLENICNEFLNIVHKVLICSGMKVPDSKVHGANMGPTWVLSAPDGPHIDPMNLAIWGVSAQESTINWISIKTTFN